MPSPNGFETTTTAAAMLQVTYTKFMRVHSQQIPSVQLHQRGPRLFKTEDVLSYRDQLESLQGE